MTDDWRVVFESRTRAACADRALVLSSVGIRHAIWEDAGGCALVVPAEQSGDAVRELTLYEEENPPVRPEPRPRIVHHDALPGLIGYVLIVCAVAWFAGIGAFADNWFAAGRVDGELIRDGQWWRLFTALTLHGSVSHLLGNLVFGTLFGLFAGRLLGPGVAWSAIVVCAGLGNLSNTLLLESAHRSIGASTAVFAALGLVAGFVWRAKLMSQERWPYRLGPIVGGLALLMFTGTGDENTDVGAHLMGFLSGFAGGIVLTRWKAMFESRRLQIVTGVSAVSIVALAWLVGLSSAN